MPKIIDKRGHLVHGNFYGDWYWFDSGSMLYVATREGDDTRGYFRLKNAWCIDEYTLEQCIKRDVQWIVVKHIVSGFTKRAKKQVVEYYATRVEDFYGSQSGEHRMGVTRQRYLSRQFWRITPVTAKKAIAKKMGIGKMPAEK